MFNLRFREIEPYTVSNSLRAWSQDRRQLRMHGGLAQGVFAARYARLRWESTPLVDQPKFQFMGVEDFGAPMP